MKLILHIGRPKTGSTTLQESLVKDRVRLESNGFYVAPEFLGNPNNTRIANYLGAKSPHYEARFGRDATRFADFGNRFSTLINTVRTSYHSFIISSEFFSRLRTDAALMRAKSFFHDHFSRIQIVSYFREQANLIPSSYSQAVKAAETRTFHEFISGATQSKGLFYFQFADAWRTRMSDAELNMRLYFPDSWSIVDDFWGKVLLLEPPSTPTRANRALSAQTAQKFRLINMSFPYVTKRNSISQTNIGLKRIAKRMETRRAEPLILTEEEAIRIRELFNDNNQRFAQTFQPSGHTSLKDFETRWQGLASQKTGQGAKPTGAKE